MAVRLQNPNRLSRKLVKELEMDDPLSWIILGNELWICRDAVESTLVMGNFDAYSIFCANNYEYKKSSQGKYLDTILLKKTQPESNSYAHPWTIIPMIIDN